MEMEMEMEKAKDTQRASEETDNLVHFRCQAIGKQEGEGEGERKREGKLDGAGILRWN